MNPLDHMDRTIAYAADHRAQLLKEAEIDRLLQAAQPQERRSAGRVLDEVGDWLIATGRWLKGRGQTAVPPVR